MKTSIIKLVLLTIASISTFACTQSQGWSEKDKKDFLKGCVSSNQGRLSQKLAQDACGCMLNKVEKKHPNVDEAQKLRREEIRDIAFACWKETIAGKDKKE